MRNSTFANALIMSPECWLPLKAQRDDEMNTAAGTMVANGNDCLVGGDEQTDSRRHNVQLMRLLEWQLEFANLPLLIAVATSGLPMSHRRCN